MYYLLNDDHTYYPCTLREWSDQVNGVTIRIGFETIGDKDVSTIWLGLDHSHSLGAPILFETMVFDTRTDEIRRDIYCTRHTTWQEAEEGHAKAVEWVKNGCLDE